MKRTPLFVVGVAVLALAAGWFLFIRNDAPPPVSLEEAVETATSTSAPASDTEAEAEAAADDEVTATTGIDGTWTIDTSNSFAGYRIGEELANIGTIEAVGRTSEINGSLTATDSTITAVTVEVDMQTLRSDRSQRDGALQGRGLETDSFPAASFELTTPIELGGVPASGESVQATASGDLTLHGMTNPVELALEAQVIDDGTVVVVGSADITLSDYAIEAPTGFAVLSINEVGTLELQLEFDRI